MFNRFTQLYPKTVNQPKLLSKHKLRPLAISHLNRVIAHIFQTTQQLPLFW